MNAHNRPRPTRLLLTLALVVILSPVASVAQQAATWEDVPKAVRDRKPFKRFEWFYRQRAMRRWHVRRSAHRRNSCST
jgi:hypothetical protein